MRSCRVSGRMVTRDDSIVDKVEPFSRLSQLAQDFEEAALCYGRIIISEHHLPISEKTIKPSDSMGGIAGGNKFIVPQAGILFKFATRTHGLYDTMEDASKAASRELLGLSRAWASLQSIPSLSLPLMCLVKYRGFVLTAETLLPIHKTTLRYGSDNAGEDVMNGLDKGVDESAKKLAETLNLCEHDVKPSKARLHLPCDIELHRSISDGRIYALDLARLFPAEPANAISGARAKKNAYLIDLLRPELVLRSPLAVV